MNHNFKRLIWLAVTIMGLSLSMNAQGFFRGDGTAASPYVIATKADLKRLSENNNFWESHFKQTADIVLVPSDFQPGGDFYNDGRGFIPIGNYADGKFKGSYDGNGHTIVGLFINRQGKNYAGMFGWVDLNDEIKNLTLLDVNITGDSYTGGLIGNIKSGSVMGCRVTGMVNGLHNVGGLIGYTDNSVLEIDDCHVEADIIGLGDAIAGLIGYHSGFYVNLCSVIGTVSGQENVGGLVGFSETISGYIIKSYSCSTVSGVNTVGGFAGFSDHTITDSYSRGNVIRASGEGAVLGGFTGSSHGNIYRCYSTGSVSGIGWSPSDKGFMGEYISGILSRNYWDIQTSAQASSAGQGAYQVEGKSTAEMLVQATYENWNFTNTWVVNSAFNNGYPALQWQLTLRNPFPVDGSVGVSLWGNLSWDFSFGTESYVVMFGKEGYLDTVASGVPAGLTGSKSYTNLDYLTAYQWQIIEVKGDDAIAGPVWNFTSGPPNSLICINPENGDTDVPICLTLQWHNSPYALSYDLYFGEPGNMVGVSSGPAGTYRSFELDTLPFNTTYSWQVIEEQESLIFPGPIWSFSTTTNCVKNPVPENDKINISTLATTLQWDDVYGASGYYISIYYHNWWGSPIIVANHVYCNQSEFTLNGRWSFGRTYNWRVEPVFTIPNPNPCEVALWKFTTLPLMNVIDSWEDLLALSQYPDYWHLDIQQTADIDASASAYLDDSDDNGDGDRYNDPNDFTAAGSNDGFSPIGNADMKFSGSFNGNDHKITGLYINRPDQNYVGMFGVIDCPSTEIKNLRVEADITGSSCTGGLVGLLTNGIIKKCSITGSIIGNHYAGGLCGSAGAFGAGVYVVNCQVDANISGTLFVGGLAGYNSYNLISNSYTRGNIVSLSGYLTNFGGFIGKNDLGTIEQCYSTVKVFGSTDYGFLGSSNLGTAFYNYWDTQTSGQTSSAGQGDDQIEGKTTAEMQQQATFVNWDFTNTWTINPLYNDGYPCLQWQHCFDPLDGGTIADSQTICSGTSPDPLTSITSPNGYAGTIDFKWQICTVSPTFVDIPEATSITYTHVGTVTQTTWFRRLARVDCMDDWSGAASSNVVKIAVNSPGPVTRVNIRAEKAEGGMVKFKATPVNGGAKPYYRWYKIHGATQTLLAEGENVDEILSTCKSGDEHWVELTSSIPCTAVATSNAMCTY